MSAWPATIVAQDWEASTVDALAARIERCGQAVSELGARGRSSAARALELAAALRAAGRALAFVDDDDVDALFVVVERLDRLKRESDGLFALWQLGDAPWEREVWTDEEPTRVRPRIVPPAQLRARSLGSGPGGSASRAACR